MRVTVAGLELDVAPGATVAQVVAFARARGVMIPDRPWCGPVRLHSEHRAGDSPLSPFARLTAVPGPDARPRMGAHVAVVGGPDAGLAVTVSDGMMVGRAAGSDVRLSDPTVSTHHARLGRGRLVNVNAVNGTVVDGRRVRWRSRVSPGAAVRLGDTTVVMHTGSEDKASPARRPWGLVSSAGAGLSMAVVAAASGRWLLAGAVLAVPAIVGLVVWLRTREHPPVPLLDVTATLGLPDLPAGHVAVRGPRELLRAVTLVVGAPPRSAPQWEPWMTLLPAAPRQVAWLAGGEEAPSWAHVHVSAEGAELMVTAHGETQRGPLPLVTADHADAVARRIASRAAGDALPREVSWAELPPSSPEGAGGLPVRLGMGSGGPVVLDLVADGPHILVAGTTGSGKSQALQTIIASLAYDFSPREVVFALIDFKGGAGLGECAGLPHAGSLLTDLEPHLARRCLLALAAELADRKQAAAAAGVTSFDDWGAGRPPRLVVVVDEFQEIASADRDFLPQLARLAAQGRSLGMHLVLATQRPAGAVGADIRANISATVALRTASAAESSDLIGTGAAADIAADSPGRAIVVRGGAAHEVQVALPRADPPPPIRLIGEPASAGRSLVDVARTRHSGRAEPLWLPPLPATIAPSAADGWVLGIADVPATRSREPVVWDPAAGPLVVTGPPRSGRTSALRAVASIAQRRGMNVAWLPDSPRLAVRTLALALERPDGLLVVDDAARLLTLAATADAEVTDLLHAVLRVMPAALAVPGSWAGHRLAAGGLRMVLTGLADSDEAAWDVPRQLRGLPAVPGRARVHSSAGWREAQLALPGPWQSAPSVHDLPPTCPPVPRAALGIGGDSAQAVLLPPVPSVVIGTPGVEREAVARRVEAATGIAPTVAESAFAAPSAPVVIVVRPTHRTVREAIRDAPRGLVEPSPVPMRVVASISGQVSAVQVADVS